MAILSPVSPDCHQSKPQGLVTDLHEVDTYCHQCHQQKMSKRKWYQNTTQTQAQHHAGRRATCLGGNLLVTLVTLVTVMQLFVDVLSIYHMRISSHIYTNAVTTPTGDRLVTP